MKKVDIVGKKFNRLTVISEYDKRTNAGKVQFLCKCDCGNIIIAVGSKIKSGYTKSCRCLNKEKTSELGKSYIHKMAGTSIYTIWSSMKSRCHHIKSDSYGNYGGRGIIVCERWRNSFENFFQDMGHRPNDKYSLERINNDGNYEPENCKWATRQEQELNKRNSIRVDYNGKIISLPQLAKNIGMPLGKLYKQRKKQLNGIIKYA